MTVALIHKKDVGFTQEQNQLIKKYLCKGINDDELHLFAAVCKKTGLDPFMKQIYAVKRGDQMTIQTAIDGFRLIAERTGRYCPGQESTFVYKGDRLFSATSYVKKQTKDGTWHEISASAHFDEYKPNYKSQFWDSKPHVMLAKCAESLALRKAFPNELSGLYTSEEMDQAENISPSKPKVKQLDKQFVSEEQAQELQILNDHCSKEVQEKMSNRLESKKIRSFQEYPLECYEATKKWLKEKADEHQEYLMNQLGVEVVQDEKAE
jgi:phage recombination protein Bet